MARRKFYTVKITSKPGPSFGNIWYANHLDKEYRAVLVVAENSGNTLVPVFKCTESPFFHIYPDHCTIVKEEVINL